MILLSSVGRGTLRWRFQQRFFTVTAVVTLFSACGSGGEKATAPVAVLTTINVTLSASSIQVGQNANASASGLDQNGASISLGTVAWSSGSTSIATVNASGVVTGVVPGQVVITASAGGRTGQQSLIVIPIQVATVTVSPTSATLVPGQAQQFTATTKDATGNTLTGRTVTWSSSDTTKAKVSSAGLVAAVALGTVTITASSETKAGTATITVMPLSGLGVGFGLEQFSLIPAGAFQMGSTAGYRPDEVPVHSVTISRAFYMQKTEVTQGQWRAVMGSNPSVFSTCGDNCPVENVSWGNITTFIAALNAQTPGVIYRLPTEAEWEYAARAGTTGELAGTLDEMYAPLDVLAWFGTNSGNKTHAVAGKKANDWGLFDMLGNVWEWTNDWYGPYSSTSVTDPTGPATGSDRVMRGGSCFDGVQFDRMATRGYDSPSLRHESSLGFRLVRIP